MASPILHIKDSYYFEVPKSLWPARYGDKTEFPEVWTRLDPQFQAWEASRLYEEYAALKSGDVAAKTEVLAQYEEWKHDHKNEGKPFDRFLREELDKEWFDSHFEAQGARQGWEKARERAGDLTAFNSDESIRWSPETVHAYNRHLSGKILIPQPFGKLRNLYERESGLCHLEVHDHRGGGCACILCGVFSWLARQVEEGERPRGRLWNFLEALCCFHS